MSFVDFDESANPENGDGGGSSLSANGHIGV